MPRAKPITRRLNYGSGRTVDPRGYVLIRVGKDHHLADVRGYAYEHRLVAEENLGRPLRSGEQIHHKNENKSDNRPENLQVMRSMAHHRYVHRKKESVLRALGEANPLVSCRCGCETVFSLYDSIGRPRKFVSGHNTRIRNGQ